MTNNSHFEEVYSKKHINQHYNQSAVNNYCHFVYLASLRKSFFILEICDNKNEEKTTNT